ncbi:MAG: hypothetical protein AAB870_01785, partial [Patescibacteria group bacterium]
SSRNREAGYQNYCLNWYPVGYIAGQSNVLGGDHPLPAYSGSKPLYYCVESKGGAKGFDSAVPASTAIKTQYAVKTRDTSVFRFSDISNTFMMLRDTKDEIARNQQAQAIASKVAVSIVDGMTGKAELNIPTYNNKSNAAQIVLTFPQEEVGANFNPSCDIDKTELLSAKTTLDLTMLTVAPVGTVCGSRGGCAATPKNQVILQITGQTREGSLPRDASQSVSIHCALNDANPITVVGTVPINVIKEPITSDGKKVSDQVQIAFSNNGTLNVPRNGLSVFPFANRNQFGYMDVTVSNVPKDMRVTCDLEKGYWLGDWGENGERQSFERRFNLNYFKVPPFPVAETAGIWDWSYRTNNYIPSTGWDVKDGKYSGQAVGGDKNGGGRVKFTVVAASTSTSTRSELKNLYCSFGAGAFDVDIKVVMKTAPFTVAVGSQASLIVKKMIAFANESFIQAKSAIVRVASVLRHKTASALASITHYRIAGVSQSNPNIYEVIKPQITFSSSSINFMFDDVAAETIKSVRVSSDPAPRINDKFAWRAVIDASKTPRIDIEGGYVSSLFYLTRDHGEANGEVSVAVRKEVLGSLPSGTYKGAVKVYAMAPLEGIAAGNTERILNVSLTIPNNRSASTVKNTGLPLEASPEASTIKDSFSASVEYLNFDPAINDGRLASLNPPKLITGTSPLYGTNQEIKVRLDVSAGTPPFCNVNSIVQARLIYSYIGEGAWFSLPVKDQFGNTIPGAQYQDNGEIKRNFQEGSCESMDFILNSGTGSGIQYYFVVQNQQEQTAISQRFYVDVKNMAQLNDEQQAAVKDADSNNPISAQLRDPQYGIGDTQYPARAFSDGDLKLSSVVPKTEGLLGYKKYHYKNNISRTDKFGTDTDNTEEYTSVDYKVEDVTSANMISPTEPVPYCGGGAGKPCETNIPWLAPKESPGSTTGPRTRLTGNSSLPSDSPVIMKELNLPKGQENDSVAEPVYIQTEIINPQNVNEKFLVTDTQYTKQPYQGNVKVRVNITKQTHHVATNSDGSGEYQHTNCNPSGCTISSGGSQASGYWYKTDSTSSCDGTTCTTRSISTNRNCGSEVTPACGQEITTVSADPHLYDYLRDVSARLVVRPAITLPDKVDLTFADIGIARPLLVDANPKNTVYHWRAVIESIDKIPRSENGEFNWLSISPSAGMSGTNISLSVSPEAAASAEPGTKYTAKVKIYATSPVEGTSSKIVNVTFIAPIAPRPLTIAAINPDAVYSPETRVGLVNVSGEDSVMILQEFSIAQPDNRRIINANAFEKSINKDQIAQINYTIEHRTRQTLPGVDWTTSALNGVDSGLVCAWERLGGTNPVTYAFPPLTLLEAVGFIGEFINDPQCPKATEDTSQAINSAAVTPKYGRFLKALPSITRPVIATTEQTNSYTMVLNSASTQDVNAANAFSANCGGRKDADIGRDFAAIKPIFDEVTGNIKAWETRYCDDSNRTFLNIKQIKLGEQKSIFVTVTIYLKDYCTNVVQVVKEDGASVPWRQTVLDAPKDAAGAPLVSQFMSLIPPVGRPEKWSQIPIINDGNTSIAHAQSLAIQSPFAQGQTTIQPICLGGSSTGNKCTTSNDCTGGGKCFGSTAQPIDKSDPLNLLNRYFATGYQQWVWNSSSKKYLKQGIPPLYTPPVDRVACSPSEVANRGIGGANCAVRPIIKAKQDKSVIDGIILTRKANSNTVELIFNSEIDPEQKPLKKITINWGSGIGEQVISYSDDDRPIIDSTKEQPRGIHHFAHTYKDDPINKQVCVEITDNWGATNAEACAIVK